MTSSARSSGCRSSARRLFTSTYCSKKPASNWATIEPVVEDGPEHRVGIAEVVALVLGGGQLDGGEPALALDQIGLTVGLDLAVPAEPERAARAHHIGKGDGNAARLWGLAQIDDPVGDQDDAAHVWLTSPQCLLTDLSATPNCSVKTPERGKSSISGNRLGSAVRPPYHACGRQKVSRTRSRHSRPARPQAISEASARR